MNSGDKVLEIWKWNAVPVLPDIRFQLLNSAGSCLLYPSFYEFCVCEVSLAHELFFYRAMLLLYVQTAVWHCLALICNGAFTDMWVTYTMKTYVSPYHSSCLLSRDKNSESMVSKLNVKLWFIRPQAFFLWPFNGLMLFIFLSLFLRDSAFLWCLYIHQVMFPALFWKSITSWVLCCVCPNRSAIRCLHQIKKQA